MKKSKCFSFSQNKRRQIFKYFFSLSSDKWLKRNQLRIRYERPINISREMKYLRITFQILDYWKSFYRSRVYLINSSFISKVEEFNKWPITLRLFNRDIKVKKGNFPWTFLFRDEIRAFLFNFILLICIFIRHQFLLDVFLFFSRSSIFSVGGGG